MPRVTLYAAAAVVASWLAGPPVGAQGEVEKARIAEARDYFEAGKENYASGQFAVAATAFEEAYRLVPRSPILFSAAQAYRRQYFLDGDPENVERAVELYRKYLAEVDKGGRRNDAEQHLITLEPILKRLEATRGSRDTPRAPAPTQLMVTSKVKGALAAIDDDEEPEATPVTRNVDPGTHKVVVQAPGYFTAEVEGTAVEGRLIVVPVDLRARPAQLSFEIPAGATVAIDGMTVDPSGAEVPAGLHTVAVHKRGHDSFVRQLELERGQELTIDAPLEISTQRRVSYFFFGGAGLLALAGTTTSLLALRAQSQADDIRARRDDAEMNLTEDDIVDHNDLLAQRDRYRTASYLVFGGAALVAVSGALMYWLDNPGAGASGPRIVPTATADGAGAALIGRFD